MRFEEFVSILPGETCPEPVDGLDGMESAPEGKASFVAPDINFVRDLEPGRTSVIIVRAPGALGKSTIARQVASVTGGLLWDLSSLAVAANSFWGTLLRNVGPEAVGSVLQAIDKGRLAVLIDAFDETQVRSSGFDAFLSEIANLAEPEHASPPFTLFARNETAAWMELFFDEAGISVAIAEPDFFNQSQSYEFLDKYLDEFTDGESNKPHRTHIQPYEEARELLIRQICTAVSADPEDAWSNERIRMFLGYAPVLQAIGALLAETNNFESLSQQLRREQSSQGSISPPSSWNILTEIMNHLVERERNKLVENVKPGLLSVARQEEWNDWDSLYCHDEQCTRSLQAALRFPDSYQNLKIPPRMAGKYLDNSRPFAQQHAFLASDSEGRTKLANLVFEEYLYAWALRVGDERLKAAVRRKLEDRERLSQPLLGYFLIIGENEGWEGSLSTQDFPFLLSSIRAASTSSSNAYCVLTADLDHENEVECFLSWPSEEDTILSLTGQDLHFGTSASSLVMVAPGVRCTVGARGVTAVVGPDVHIECGVFQIESETLRVVRGFDDVEILWSDLVFAAGTPKLYVDGEGLFAVNQGAPYPFESYASEWVRVEDSASITPDFLTLRRIMLILRGHRKGDPAKNRTWMESKIAPPGPKREMLDGLVDRGIVRREHDLYVADLDEMAEVGIAWEDLRRGELRPRVRGFLLELADD